MRETSVAKGIRSVANDYDTACKRLLSERQVLSRILNGCLEEFAATDVRVIEKECLVGDVRISDDPVDRDEAAGRVQELVREDATTAEGVTSFDIRFDALVPSKEDSDQVRVEVNVEAQNKFSPGYPLLKRAIYYCGRMISMQGADVVTKSRYGRLRKVVSIWVCTHPNRSYAGTATSFCIAPKRLLGSAEYPKPDYDMLEVVMLCLNSVEPGSSKGVLGMLEVLLAPRMSASKKLTILNDEYGMIVSESINEEVDDMCNLSEGVLEEGRREERQKFAEERRRFFETAASLVRDGILGAREAAERFGLSEDDIVKAL